MCVFSASSTASTCIVLLGVVLKAADRVSQGAQTQMGWACRAPSILRGSPGVCRGLPLPAVGKWLGLEPKPPRVPRHGHFACCWARSPLTLLFPAPGDRRKTSPDLKKKIEKKNHLLHLMQIILIISHRCYANYYYHCTKGL